MSYYHVLKVKVTDECPNRDEVVQYYTNIANKVSYEGDSGVDLIFPTDIDLFCDRVTKVKLGIQCEMIGEVRKILERKGNVVREYHENNGNEGYMLVPRSSISSTPLCMANSIGIINQGYRGEIIVPIRCFRDENHNSTTMDSKYSVKSLQRLFQIVAFDGKPIKTEVVNELSESKRGEAGFGSTNS